MTYTRNAIYTYIVNAIKAEYPNISCTSRYVPKPASFPSCYIREIDRSRPLESTQLDFEDVQWESAWEIQVVSTKSGVASSEAHAIMDVAKRAFNDLCYRQLSENAIDNGTKFTVICRFRRKIGGGDTMPES